MKHQETCVHGTEFGVCSYASEPLCTRIRRKSSYNRICSPLVLTVPSGKTAPPAPQHLTSQPVGHDCCLMLQRVWVWWTQETIVFSRSAMCFPTVWQHCGNQRQNPHISQGMSVKPQTRQPLPGPCRRCQLHSFDTLHSYESPHTGHTYYQLFDF